MKFRTMIGTGLALLAAALSGGCAMSKGAPARPHNVDEFLTLGVRPRVIAHRGFSGEAPENTMASFQGAIRVAADMLEFDVQLSKDGQVVVFHDETLERTSNGSGRVADQYWEQLSQLDAGSWFSPKFADERIPLLRDVLELAKGKILVNIEIKSEAYSPNTFESISAKVVAMVDELGMRDQVIVSSFDPRILKQVGQLDTTLKTATLYNKDVHGEPRPIVITTDEGSNAFNLSKKEITAGIVDECHSKGIPVCVYTVNTREMMQYILGLGADAIFTDRPDVMIDLLRESHPVPVQFNPPPDEPDEFGLEYEVNR